MIKIKRNTNIAFQVFGTILQATPFLTNFIPQDAQPVYHGAVGILQGVVAILAHYSNPDGTSVRAPYIPESALPVPK